VSFIDRIFDYVVSQQNRRKKIIRISAVSAAAILSAGVIHYVTVQPGDTLSELAQQACGNASDWTGIYAQNQGVIGQNPNLIMPGEHLTFKCNAATIRTALAATQDPPSHSGADDNAYVAPTSYSGGSGFQACVIARESGGNSQVMNSTGHYGLYQFSASTWATYGGNPADFGNASVAEQNQVFATAMASPGGESNWAPYDGC
jgi:LysM repeat protein